MKRIISILLFVFVLFSCSENDNQNDSDANSGCNGDTCQATVSGDENAATLPASTVGIFNTKYQYEDTGSPFTNGTTAVFEITEDEKLIVKVAGFDCITLSNPVWRFGADANSGNYTFKDSCRDMIAYNVSYNTDGTFNEVNIEPVNGPGFFGQFTLQ